MGTLREVQFLVCALTMLLFQPLASSPMMHLDHTYILTNDVRLEEVQPDNVLIDNDMMVKRDEHSVTSGSHANDDVIPTDIFFQDYYLEDFGLTRRNIYGDGNCLFRALSVGLYGTEMRHRELRQLAIDNIRNHRELFADYFLPRNTSANQQEHMDSELNRLIQTGVYAGFECIVSLSMIFGRNIYITQGGSTGSRVSTITVTIDESRGYDSSNNIHLIYSTSIGGGHYDLAVEDTTGSHFPNDYLYVDKSESGTVKSETNADQTRTGTIQLGTGTVKSVTGTVHSETGTVHSETGTVQSDTDTVQSDTDTVQSGTGTVQPGTGIVWSRIDKDRSRTDTAQSGTSTVQPGTDTFQSGAGTVQPVNDTVQSGTGIVWSRIDKVRSRTDTVQTKTGTVLLKTGTFLLRTSTVKSGTDTAISGTGTVLSGTSTVQSGTSPVQIGTGTVQSGTSTVQSGTSPVQIGTCTVQSGTGTVQKGTGTVQSGTCTVQSGTGTVQSGTVVVQMGTGIGKSGTGTVHSVTSTVQTETGTVQSGNGTFISRTGTVLSGTNIFQSRTGNADGRDDLLHTSNVKDNSAVDSSRSSLHTSNTKPLSVSKSTSTRPPFICSSCDMNFSCKQNLIRHSQNQHLHKSTQQRSLIECIEPSCKEKFARLETLFKHLALKHGISIENKTVKFSSKEEFLIWKGKEESNNNVFFTCHNTRRKYDMIEKYYHCNRNGNSKRNTLQLKRSKNKKGTCKLGHVCPARMIAYCKSNLVTVRYTDVHFHSTGFDQTKYLRIPEPVKKDISIKLRIGVPIKHILSSLQSPHSVSNKDANNIKMRQIKMLTDCDKDDANSVNLKILDLQKSLKNPVLLYKQQHVVDNNIDLNEEDFMLVLMTNEQANSFEKFAPFVLCIDSTHGTNQYQFYLITMLVINDEKKDIPVAFCVSNRDDGDALHIFFECVKKRCPETVIDSVMSADAQASVARAVFGQHVNHYLCIYNLRNGWNRALQSYGNPAQLAEFQDALTELVHSSTKQHFVQGLTQLRNTYRESHAAFFNYFDQYYIYRPESWALYAMKEGLRNRIDTNNYLEGFHRTLKFLYFDREFNHIIHRLVDILLDFETIRDCYIDMITFCSSENSKLNFDNSRRHRISCEIPDNNVQMLDENNYSVVSDGSKVCYVERVKSECDFVPCFVTCCIDPCVKLCVHLYKGSCSDTAICCKHVHKVHSMRAMIHEPLEEPDEPAIVSNNEDEMDTNQEYVDRNLRRFYQNLQRLESDGNSGMSTERLMEVNEALESIIADNNAYLTAKRKNAQDSPMKEKHQQVQRLSFGLNTVNVTEILVLEDGQF